MRNTLHIGDTRQWAKSLPPESIQAIVTSPPYFGLRSYLPADHPDKGMEMGSERTPAEFVAALVGLFRDLRPALRDDGTLWLNLGDSYVGALSQHKPGIHQGHNSVIAAGTMASIPTEGRIERNRALREGGLKPKDLIGIPWRVALALQEDGWFLRSDIIWHKPNPMPESVTDRPTRSHEYVFLLSKGPRYFYDAEAIAERATNGERFHGDYDKPGVIDGAAKFGRNGRDRHDNVTATRNKRTVWTIPTAHYPNAHFATFPPDLLRPCVMAGTSEKGACARCGAPWRRVVERTPMVIARSDRGAQMGEYGRTAASGTMVEAPTSTTIGWEPSCRCGTTETRPCIVADPFMGSGTVAQVCVEEGRDWTGCDLDERAQDWLRERLKAIPVARLAGV